MIRAHLAIETTGMNTATAVGSEGYAQDDGRERRMRNKAFHTAVALSMLDDATTPARHPEQSERSIPH